MASPPLSLYVHIPWCVRKCPYCDFNSHQAQHIPEQAYTKKLIDDLLSQTTLAYQRPIRSIFFGGGTPSLFSADSIQEILEAAVQTYGFSPDIEITLEANPGASEYTNLAAMRQAGVNRLSFGVQSFHDPHLQTLGRIHSAEAAHKAFHAARQAGFDNINIDLMHGLPGQSVSEALSDLKAACALAPEHLSWYQLTIEPNTVYFKQQPTLPDEDILADIQDAGHELLATQGYEHYEISAYSRPGKYASHNINYWSFGDYLGVGAGAHGKSSHPDGSITRHQRTRLPQDYLESTFEVPRLVEPIEKAQQCVEFMMNALRLVEGVPKALFLERTQWSKAELAQALSDPIERGLIAQDALQIRATPLGRCFLNDTVACFANKNATTDTRKSC